MIHLNPETDLNPGIILGGSLANNPNIANLDKPLGMLQRAGVVILSIGTITSILFLLIYITKLGAAGDNPAARRSAIIGILVSGGALSLLGGLTAVLVFFWNLI